MAPCAGACFPSLFWLGHPLESGRRASIPRRSFTPRSASRREFGEDERKAGAGHTRHPRHRLVPLPALDRDRGACRRGHASLGAGLEGDRASREGEQGVASRSHPPRCGLPLREDGRARTEGRVSKRRRSSDQDGAARSGGARCQPRLSQRRAALRQRSLRRIRDRARLAGAALLEMHDGNDRLVLDHGASGAPVLDCEGRVVAVVSTLITQTLRSADRCRASLDGVADPQCPFHTLLRC